MKKIIVVLALLSLPMFGMDQKVKVDESSKFLQENALKMLERCSQKCWSNQNSHCMDQCMLQKGNAFKDYLTEKYTERCKGSQNPEQCLATHLAEVARRAQSKE